MITRHKWRLEVECSSCNARGKVLVLEDGGPPFEDTPRREFQVGEAFEVLADEVRCRRCDLPVKLAT